jgi:hypothetical protein
LSCFGQQVQGAVQLQRCFGRFAERCVVRPEERIRDVATIGPARHDIEHEGQTLDTRSDFAAHAVGELAQRAEFARTPYRAGRPTRQLGTGRGDTAHAVEDAVVVFGIAIQQDRQEPFRQGIAAGPVKFERFGVEQFALRIRQHDTQTVA